MGEPSFWDIVNAVRPPAYEGDSIQVVDPISGDLITMIAERQGGLLNWAKDNPRKAKLRGEETGGESESGVAGRHATDLEQRERFKGIDVQQDVADRESREKIASLNAAISQLQLEETAAHNRAQEELARGNLEESKRQFDLSHELGSKRHELERAKFGWEQESFKVSSGLEEHRNRIQEAGVTGYYRPTATTPFSRPASNTAMSASAPTLARDQWQASQANQPSSAYSGVSAAPPPAVAPPAATQAPAVNTGSMNLKELAKHFATQQTGPKAQGTAAQAPNAQPNEAQVNSEQKVVKRTVTEVFG